MQRRLVIATRESALALAQVSEVQAAFRAANLFADREWQVMSTSTPGDRDLKTPLSDPSVAQDFFTREVDHMLLSGQADLAVHSAKDLPQPLPKGLTIAALRPARDIRDALVVRPGLAADDVRIVGSTSPRRNAEMARVFPAWHLKPLRGTIPDRLAQLNQGTYDAIVVAACALDRLGLTEQVARYMPWDPTPQQGRLALLVREDRSDLIEALRALDVREQAGMVALAGCPADMSLAPRRTVMYLQRADVVVHDRLVPDEALALIRGKAIAVGKTGGGPSTPQYDIHRWMLHLAEEGKLVVRLHGGDPGIYGRLQEELEFLLAWGMRVDIAPAVTAAQVAAARSGAPLTHRGDGHRLTLISGNPPPGEPVPPVPGPESGNLAVYMGAGAVADLQQRFFAAGWNPDAPVIVGERLGYTDEHVQVVPLEKMDGLKLSSPTVFLVGAKARKLPARTLFTGTDPEHFLRFGPLLHWPMIVLTAEDEAVRVAALDAQLSEVRGIIFPSRFAVRCLVEAAMVHGDLRRLAGKRLLAVGPSTRDELAATGLKADAAASNFGGIEALAMSLPDEDRGAYGYPCSNESPTEQRVERMRTLGIDLRPAVFYRNTPTPFRPLPRQPFDRVIFTSGSCVNAYFERYPEELHADRQWHAVGPSTLAVLQQKGLTARLLP